MSRNSKANLKRRIIERRVKWLARNYRCYNCYERHSWTRADHDDLDMSHVIACLAVHGWIITCQVTYTSLLCIVLCVQAESVIQLSRIRIKPNDQDQKRNCQNLNPLTNAHCPMNQLAWSKPQGPYSWHAAAAAASALATTLACVLYNSSLMHFNYYM